MKKKRGKKQRMEYRVVRARRKTVGLHVDGEGNLTVRAPYRLPEAEIEKILFRHRRWISARVAAAKAHPVKELTKEQIRTLRREARAYCTAKTAEYAKKMGLSYGKITITGAKTRFGSCSSAGNISYSYRLMFCPESAREYVIVHELAHLVEMNHSPAFYRVVESALPDYKERRKLLKN